MAVASYGPLPAPCAVESDRSIRGYRQAERYLTGRPYTLHDFSSRGQDEFPETKDFARTPRVHTVLARRCSAKALRLAQS